MSDETKKIEDVAVDKSPSGGAPVVDNIPSRTTAEQDLRTAGQREINLIWETTQRHIALFVVAVGCTVSAIVVIYSVLQGSTADPLVLAAFTLLSNICFLVAGFYFGRTNHARIGDDAKQAPTKGGLDDR